MNMLLTIVGIIFAILQIILFFKLWGMTNDVREIKDRYLNSNYEKENNNPENFTSTDDVPVSNNKYKEDNVSATMYIIFVIVVILIIGIIISYNN